MAKNQMFKRGHSLNQSLGSRGCKSNNHGVGTLVNIDSREIIARFGSIHPFGMRVVTVDLDTNGWTDGRMQPSALSPCFTKSMRSIKIFLFQVDLIRPFLLAVYLSGTFYRPCT